MAKPDIDDGWIKLAHELGAAIAVSGFTTGAQVVLYHVFAQIYGPAKLRSAVLSPTAMAADGGRCKQFYDRGRRELVDSGVLRRLPDGSFRFIKDYESWTRSDGRSDSGKVRRLSRADVKFCKEAPARAMAYKVVNQTDDASTKGVNQTDDVSTKGVNQIDDKTSTELMTIVNRIDDEKVTNGVPPPNPPLVNAREFKKGEVREGERDSLSLSGGEGEANGRPVAVGVDINAIWERAFGKQKGS